MWICKERTFFLIFPRMWASRFSPSKHWASRQPLPSIFVTCAYSWPSSRNTSSRLSSSFSFFPRLLFFPPCYRDIRRSNPFRAREEDLTNLSFILHEEILFSIRTLWIFACKLAFGIITNSYNFVFCFLLFVCFCFQLFVAQSEIRWWNTDIWSEIADK